MTIPFDPSTLAPGLLWSYFAALSRLPRGSGEESAATAYLMAEAARLGLPAEQDAAGNVLITKPATPGREDSPVTALQGHVDMVCEKNRDKVHDFTREPLTLIREEDWLRADGTTLGADNAIGVAAALAVLASPNLPHGPLECLFTVDEERGLTGAVACREGWLRARYLLNLDGEDPGELTISCAGGLETHVRTQVRREAAAPGAEALLLQVGGLKGGHSGVDIHLGRGNAIHVLARALEALLAVPGTALARMEGGSRRNVIPREAAALLLAQPSQLPALRAAAARILQEVRDGLGAFDPELTLTLEPSPDRPADVLRQEEARRLVALLDLLPHGVLAMSPEIPGLVQTSTNLAVLSCAGPEAEVVLSHRSSLAWERDEAGRSAATLARQFGCQVSHGGAYPGWKPEPFSDLVVLAQATFAGLTGTPASLRAIHAGLECGILGDKHPGLQMISFGPHIVDAHSPQERVSITSVARFWDFLTALLAKV